MGKCKVAAICMTFGCAVGSVKRLQAFNGGMVLSGQRSVENGRVRPQRVQASLDTDATGASASTFAIRAMGGAALASAAAIGHSAYRHGGRSSGVARKQAFRSAADEKFDVGQKVIVYGQSGNWEEGIVTSAAPLLVRTPGSAESQRYSKVVAAGSSWSSAMPPSAKPFNPAEQLGVTQPLGFFDPLGLSNVDEEVFRHFRAAEIKHGRVAMLAAVGCVGQHYMAIPGFEDVPRGLGAFDEFPGNFGFLLVVLASGFVELNLWKEDKMKLPGDYGNPWNPFLLEVTDDLRNKEINNGRMAMISMLGIIVAEMVTGRDGIEQIFGIDG